MESTIQMKNKYQDIHFSIRCDRFSEQLERLNEYL